MTAKAKNITAFTAVTAKEFHKNPRKITEKQYSLLELTMRELGDLSGIVHDLNSVLTQYSKWQTL